MKKTKKNSGFTLVECVVAMAVLTIMSLLLMMFLNISISQRNRNIQREKDLDEQIENLVKAEDIVAEAQEQEIVFKQNGIEIDKIPGNGSEGVTANKIFNDDMDSEIDALNYDFSGYNKFENISNGGGTDEPTGDGGGTSKVYGAVKLNGKVHIEETSKKDNGNDTLDVTLSISFTLLSDGSFTYDLSNGLGMEKGVKIAVPASAKIISAKVTSINGLCQIISSNVVRIQPKNDNENHSVEFTFRISNTAYDEVFKNVSYYFTGVGNSNVVDVEINA